MSLVHLLFGRLSGVFALATWGCILFSGPVAPAEDRAAPEKSKDGADREKAIQKMADEVMAAFAKKTDSEMDPYVQLGAEVESADFQEVASLTSAVIVDERLQKLKDYRAAVERAQKFLRDIQPLLEAMAATHRVTKEEAADFAQGVMGGSPQWSLMREYMALHPPIAELLEKRFTLIKEHFGKWKVVGDDDVTFRDPATTKAWKEMKTKLKALEGKRDQLEDKIIEFTQEK